MKTKLLKLAITLAMMAAIVATLVAYMGATNLKGKASIILTGLLITVSLAVVHSWLTLRPVSFREWLKH